MRIRSFVALVGLIGGLEGAAPGQTRVDLRTQSKSVDFSGALSTKSFKMGATLPSTCALGETFFHTAQPAGQNLYGCTGPNTWTLQSGQELPAAVGQSGKVLSSDGTSVQWRGLDGDVNGSPEALVVQKLRGRTLGIVAPSDGDVLRWNATANIWEPGAEMGAYLAGIGIQITGGTIATEDALVPVYYTGTGTPGLDCAAGRDLYTDTTNGKQYFCKSDGVWQELSNAGGGLIPSGGTSGQVLAKNSDTDYDTHWVNQSGGGGGGGTSAWTVVSYSATPTFTVTAGSNVQNFKITLTGNVTSSTLSTGSATTGQDIAFSVCQDGTGNHSFAWPASVQNAAVVDGTATACTLQVFRWNGANAVAIAPALITGGGTGIDLPGSTSGKTTMTAEATASGTVTIPSLTGKATVSSVSIGDGAMVVGDGGGAGVKASTLNGGVVKMTSGVPSLVSGNATDCVLVNGTSGSCGGAAGAVALFGGINATLSTTMQYMSAGFTGFGSAEPYRQGTIPVTGALKKLRVVTANTETNGELTITVRTGTPSADTAITITIPNGSAAGVYSDLVHTAAVMAGDLYSISFRNSSGTSATIVSWSMVIE